MNLIFVNFLIYLIVLLSFAKGKIVFWQCDFETDNCLLETTVPDDLRIYKFRRGHLNSSLNSTGKCMYAKQNSSFIKEAYLYSKKLKIPIISTIFLCLKFDLLLTSFTDKLYIYALKNGRVLQVKVFSASYSDYKKWITKEISLNGNFDQCIIKAEKVTESDSIVAIDNIEINSCSNDLPTLSPPSSLSVKLNCNFNLKNFCQYSQQTNGSSWQINDPTIHYLPPYQDVSKTGHFAHINSYFCKNGVIESFHSPLVTINEKGCKFSFYYFISGNNVANGIKIYTKGKGNQQNLLLDNPSSSGNGWIKRTVDLPVGSYNIIFERECKWFSSYSFAIDQLKMESCKVGSEESTAATTAATSTVRPIANKYPPERLQCTFEKGFCNYTQKSSFNWSIGTKTPSLETGPQQTYFGQFVYFEASYAYETDVAILESPIVYINKKICLSFIYNMYGEDMGHFLVSLVTLDKNKQIIVGNETLLYKHENQGKQWLKFSHTIHGNSSKIVYQRLLFYGFYSKGYTGDIAFDEIKIADGVCQTSKPDIDINKPLCGRTGNISAVKNASIADFPWHVWIYGLINSTYYIVCEGAIVHKRFILTTAACELDRYTKFSIIAGSSKRYSGKAYYGEKFIKHSKYSHLPINYNLALIRLEKEIEFSDKINPACLIEQNLNGMEEYECYVTSYGTLKPKILTYNLTKLQQNLVNEQQCKESFFINYTLYPETLCAKSSKTSQSQSIYYDIGSPLSCKVNGKWFVGGILQNSTKLYKNGLILYSQTGKNYRWIEKTIKNNINIKLTRPTVPPSPMTQKPKIRPTVGLNHKNCGVLGSSPLIIGGRRVTSAGEFPWQVKF
ncbi:DgyrCDS14426 [Dimorphilus gyrociliatus]|uniref:DgyrCDS14426 n=1 Tax=Dimorphilus gyrociliatus TaxID=2664684 RepID=A0A7I8WDK5_9ANNE|nr:DgyrCDS14426 [Dimorphilus gyrociliatus]